MTIPRDGAIVGAIRFCRVTPLRLGSSLRLRGLPMLTAINMAIVRITPDLVQTLFASPVARR